MTHEGVKEKTRPSYTVNRRGVVRITMLKTGQFVVERKVIDFEEESERWEIVSVGAKELALVHFDFHVGTIPG